MSFDDARSHRQVRHHDVIGAKSCLAIADVSKQVVASGLMPNTWAVNYVIQCQTPGPSICHAVLFHHLSAHHITIEAAGENTSKHLTLDNRDYTVLKATCWEGTSRTKAVCMLLDIVRRSLQTLGPKTALNDRS